MDKSTVNDVLRNAPRSILRNYILAHRAIWRLYKDASVEIGKRDKLAVVYDKSMGSESIWEFNEYLRKKVG